MVNPIPASRETPNKYLQFRSPGMMAMPDLIAIKQASKMPATFPTMRPAIIPNELREVSVLNRSDGKTITVFTKANTGSTKNATGLCRRCCNRNEGFLSLAILGNGMANASKTPEMVACTPDCIMQYHMITPPIRYTHNAY